LLLPKSAARSEKCLVFFYFIDGGPLMMGQSTVNFWLFCIHPAVPAPDLPTHEKRKAAVAKASCRLGNLCGTAV
jgi:hypothetical protein